MADPARPLAVQLHDTADLMARLLAERLESAEWPPLTRNQTLVLIHLASAATTPAELARLLNVSRQSMQKILEHLSDLEFVELIAHPTDQRSKLATLMTAGVEFTTAMMRILDGFERRLEAAFGTETIWTVRRVLSADWTALFETIDDQKASGR